VLLELMPAMNTNNVLIHPFMGAAGIPVGTAFGTDPAPGRALAHAHARR
jgi:hypothetical protein